MDTTLSSKPADQAISFSLDALEGGDEVRGPENMHLHKRREKKNKNCPYDYVFFDWKGTLAKKSGLNTKERTHIRLRRFYEALQAVLQDNERDASSGKVAVPINSGDLSECEDEAEPTTTSTAPSDATTRQVELPTFEHLETTFDKLMLEHKGDDGNNTFAWTTFLSALLYELGLGDLDDSHKNRLYTAFQVGVSDSGLYHGAEEILRWLREEAGLRLGLIRNSKLGEEAMRTRIAKAGIDPSHFESVVMGGEVGFAKPDAEVFISAARTANIEHVHSADPKRILYIGNEVDADVHGANGVGWTSVLVTHTESTSHGKADYEIGHLMQLKDIVLRSQDDTEEAN